MSDSAQVIELAEAKLPRRDRERLIAERNRAKQMARMGLVPIRSMQQALTWGEGWMKAHDAQLRLHAQEVDALKWELLLLRSDLICEQAERLIERIAFEDEIKRLRGLTR